MRFFLLTLMVLLFAAVSGESASSVGELALYKRDIIERFPFGRPVVIGEEDDDDPVVIAPIIEPWSTTVQVVAIVRWGDFVRVGFVYKGKNYFLHEGETEDGIKALKVFPSENTALLEYDGRAEKVMMTSLPTQVVSRLAGMNRAMTGVRKGAPVISYKERLKLRREQLLEARRKQREEARAGMNSRELESHLREYQLKVIRDGGKSGPALPIPLTREMDEQLVREGVLPPRG